MSSYQSETVYTKEWFGRPESIIIESSWWPTRTNNLLKFQPPSATPFALITSQLQTLVKAIVLDQELIAECRSGEI